MYKSLTINKLFFNKKLLTNYLIAYKYLYTSYLVAFCFLYNVKKIFYISLFKKTLNLKYIYKIRFKILIYINFFNSIIIISIILLFIKLILLLK